MTRIAETLPELWLNRRGFFTIRGLKPKKGHGEIDLLAYKPCTGEAIHMEVSASLDPRGFLGGKPANRIAEGVAEFVANKYDRENLVSVREGTCPTDMKWQRMLAHGSLNRESEVCAALIANGVEPKSLYSMLSELSKTREGERLPYRMDADAAYFAGLAHAFAKWSNSSG